MHSSIIWFFVKNLSLPRLFLNITIFGKIILKLLQKPQAFFELIQDVWKLKSRKIHNFSKYTLSDKIRWDTLPYGREKAASSPFPPFQCCSYVVKNFDIHVDLQHWFGDGGRMKLALPNWESFASYLLIVKILRTLKNTYENVPTILSKIVERRLQKLKNNRENVLWSCSCTVL